MRFFLSPRFRRPVNHNAERALSPQVFTFSTLDMPISPGAALDPRRWAAENSFA